VQQHPNLLDGSKLWQWSLPNANEHHSCTSWPLKACNSLCNMRRLQLCLRLLLGNLRQVRVVNIHLDVHQRRLHLHLPHVLPQLQCLPRLVQLLPGRSSVLLPLVVETATITGPTTDCWQHSLSPSFYQLLSLTQDLIVMTLSVNLQYSVNLHT
jgi:hypothetical protein